MQVPMVQHDNKPNSSVPKGGYKMIYSRQIAKIEFNNWCKIHVCCYFSKCQYVVLNVQQCNLLHGYATHA